MTDDAVLESLKTIQLTLASHTSALGQIRTELARINSDDVCNLIDRTKIATKRLTISLRWKIG